MSFLGTGFYAMWNGMDPAYVPEFELMHARSHMLAHVAYLGSDGILAARRHGHGVGTLPSFFTFYDMKSLDVLTDASHEDCRVVETPWFLSLRSKYRDHIRHHCRVVGRAGAGVGGSIATVLLRLSSAALDNEQRWQSLCEQLVANPSITAAHFGIADPSVPTMVGGSPPPRDDGDEPVATLIVEGYDRFALAGVLPSIAKRFLDDGLAEHAPRMGHYSLSLALEYDEIKNMHRIDSRPDAG
jgi:hypothetical protein